MQIDLVSLKPITDLKPNNVKSRSVSLKVNSEPIDSVVDSGHRMARMWALTHCESSVQHSICLSISDQSLPTVA